MGTFRLKKVKRGAFHTSIRTSGGVSKSRTNLQIIDNCSNRLVDIHNNSCESAYSLAAKEARSLANEARRNAKWKDRTSRVGRGRHARASIVGRTSEGAFTTNIIVKGGEGVYDVRKGGKRGYYHFLEAAMGKKYATIKPTVNRRSQEVIRKFGHNMLRGE